MYKIVSIKTQI